MTNRFSYVGIFSSLRFSSSSFDCHTGAKSMFPIFWIFWSEPIPPSNTLDVKPRIFIHTLPSSLHKSTSSFWILLSELFPFEYLTIAHIFSVHLFNISILSKANGKLGSVIFLSIIKPIDACNAPSIRLGCNIYSSLVSIISVTWFDSSNFANTWFSPTYNSFITLCPAP